MAQASQPAGSENTASKARAATSRIPAAAWVGAAALVVVAGALFLHRPSPHAGAGRRLPTTEKFPVTTATAPVSEALQLVAQARVLYEPWDLATPDDFALAEDLLKRAVALDPGDGEAWAAYALVAYGTRVMVDPSETWSLAARSRAEQAIERARDPPHARFARASSLRLDPQPPDETIRLLREEAIHPPTNRLVLRTLGAALRCLSHLEQSLFELDKAAALPGNDPITHCNRRLSLVWLGRLHEALAIAPREAAHGERLNRLLDIRRDLPRAQDRLDKIPPNPIANETNALRAASSPFTHKTPQGR